MTRPHPEPACAGSWPDFDEHVDGETRAQRADRLSVAVAACARCPLLTGCTPPAGGSGVYGGRLYDDTGQERPLPTKWPVQVKEPRPKGIKHGTSRGYHQHRYREEEPCDLCREAYNAEERARYYRRKKAAS